MSMAAFVVICITGDDCLDWGEMEFFFKCAYSEFFYLT